jgi:hypothetical protein
VDCPATRGGLSGQLPPNENHRLDGSKRSETRTHKEHEEQPADGEALGATKVGEGSGENEGKIKDIPEPPKTHNKNAYTPKPNPLRNRLDTTPAPPVFPPHTDDFQKPIKFKSNLGNEFFGKKGEKLSEGKPEPKTKTKTKTKTLPV